MKLTVLICTHNRQQLLRKVVESLDRAKRPEAVDCEILVVANACVDGSVDWLTERAGKGVAQGSGPLPLRFAEEQRLGKSNALNCGIDILADCHVDQHLVAMVDDDQRADEGYLLGLARAAREFPDFSMFCGRLLPDWDGREPGWVHDQGQYRIYPLPVPRFERGDQPLAMTPDIGVPSGGNLLVRAEVFTRVGGFARDFGPQGHNLVGGEDGEFIRRAQAQGERLQYVPWFTQYHYVELERLQTFYLMRKSFQRTKAGTLLDNDRVGSGVPKYLWRKLAEYAAGAVWSLSWARTRFYLIRLAAAWGEVAAFREKPNS